MTFYMVWLGFTSQLGEGYLAGRGEERNRARAPEPWHRAAVPAVLSSQCPPVQPHRLWGSEAVCVCVCFACRNRSVVC